MYIIGRRAKPNPQYPNQHREITLGSNPVQHPTYEVAEQEAHRLAAPNVHHEFIIFRGQSLVAVEAVTPPIKVTSL